MTALATDDFTGNDFGPDYDPFGDLPEAEKLYFKESSLRDAKYAIRKTIQEQVERGNITPEQVLLMLMEELKPGVSQ